MADLVCDIAAIFKFWRHQSCDAKARGGTAELRQHEAPSEAAPGPKMQLNVRAGILCPAPACNCDFPRTQNPGHGET